MTTSTLITLIVGVAIPSLVALVTRETMPVKVREGILLLLSTASGIISGLATSPPGGLSQWEHVVVNILVTFVAAEASALSQAKVGTTKAIHARTDRHFGIGAPPLAPPPPPDEGLPKAA